MISKSSVPWLARIEDASTMAAILAGREWTPPNLRDRRPIRALCVPTFGDAPVAPEIRESFRAAAEALRGLGHSVAFADRFDLADAISGIWPVVSCTGICWVFVAMKVGREKLAKR
jgi:aspartyl-tRNA(Asn)/glutamyl-tRNA(Gln) amidotransferase subunit A